MCLCVRYRVHVRSCVRTRVLARVYACGAECTCVRESVRVLVDARVGACVCGRASGHAYLRV